MRHSSKHAAVALAAGLVTSIMFCSAAQAQTEGAPPPEPEEAVDFSWDVAEYDRVLAATPLGEDIRLGDMVFRRATVQHYRDRLAGADSTEGAGVGTAKWTGGVVPYTFGANVTATQRQQFIDVTREWRAFAHLTFIPWTTQANYIRVVQPATGGCYSVVGMVPNGQDLTLDPGCWVRSTILHELGHALGFHHEHQRSDRDTYVTINFPNVADQDPAKNWWARIPDTTNWSGYDFLSIMHYSRNGGAKPGTDVIVPKPADARYIDEMGRQPGMSRLDRAAAATAYGPPVSAPSAVVTNTQDSGPGTLRAALHFASDRTEVTPASTTAVQFRIPTTDPGFADTVFTIKPRAALIVGGGTIIDGASQTAFTGNTNTFGPEVVLNGSLVPTTEPASGLLMKGVNSSVRSMVINGFREAGVTIKRPTATGNTVLGNYIGTDRAGMASVFNAHSGVRIHEGAYGNRIGGAAGADRNLISGNRDYGVSIGGTGTNSNVVSGNFIGLNRTGVAALPNQFSGIVVTEGARLNQIGGTVAGAGNVVSGNSQNGVAIWGAGTTANAVRGNFIGVNPAGTARIANTFAGVSTSGGAQSNTVGGVSAFERNVISGNTNQGVSIMEAGTNANTIRGNYIGTNAAGTGAIPNGAGVLIRIGARGNLVGGTSAGAGNVISGNNNQGVAISGAGTNSNRVEGNRIGTNAAGTGALGNTWPGAAVFDGAQYNVIGGLVSGAGNTISGGKSHGVHLGGVNTRFNQLQGNRIGTNAAGTAALPNALSGVELGGVSNTFGGTAAGARNFVAGNTQYGLILSGPSITGNVIHGNDIGLLPTGAAGPNGAGGIILANGAAGNQVGGISVGAGNRISHNVGAGVAVADASTTGNAIRGNVFSSNTGLGIDLWPGGVTPNDAGDADTGPNRLQNYPVLTSAVNGTSTVVRGSLSSAPSTTFRIEFFSSPGPDPTLHGEGATYLGATSATTNTAGTSPVFAFTAPATVPAGQVITATATDPAGNTSEFSQRVVVG